MITKGAILGMGNPLLDILATVDHEFLEKYQLKMNDAILADEKHEPMYEELLRRDDKEFVAGGATQNSIRVAQWLSRTDGVTAFLGAVGKDENAEILKKACQVAGVKPLYFESDAKPTGVCAAVISEGERSLCTKLEAANEYKHSHTLKSEVQEAIKQAKIFYSASFFLTVPEGPQSMIHVAEHACSNNKIYALNLSAEFLIQVFGQKMAEIMPYTDFVFANETEAACYGKTNNLGEDLSTIALKISALPKKSGARPRVVVITQGSDPTIVAKDGKVTMYPVPSLAKNLLIDTNGAGDAFVGGFLARLADEKSIEECVTTGHYAARVVIQNSGATFPQQPDI